MDCWKYHLEIASHFLVLEMRGFGGKTSAEDQSFREIERKIPTFFVYLIRTRLIMTEVGFPGLSV